MPFRVKLGIFDMGSQYMPSRTDTTGHTKTLDYRIVDQYWAGSKYPGQGVPDQRTLAQGVPDQSTLAKVYQIKVPWPRCTRSKYPGQGVPDTKFRYCQSHGDFSQFLFHRLPGKSYTHRVEFYSLVLSIDLVQPPCSTMF